MAEVEQGAVEPGVGVGAEAEHEADEARNQFVCLLKLDLA